MLLSYIFLFASSSSISAEQLSMKKIIGGQDARPHQFPWQASLRDSENFHFCGGALISRRWVLTAAHCLRYSNTRKTISPSEIFVHLGAHYINRPVEGEIIIGVQKVIPYKNSDPFKDDIGLVQLDDDIEQTNTIKWIALARVHKVPNGKAVVSGWGSTHNYRIPKGEKRRFKFCGRTFTFPNKEHRNTVKTKCGIISVIEEAEDNVVFTSPYTLQKLGVFVHQNADCERDRLWCVGEENKGTCMGDSGGPMMQKVKGRWQLFGVTSHGFVDCLLAEGSSKFVKVDRYLAWISRILKRYPQQCQDTKSVTPRKH